MCYKCARGAVPPPWAVMAWSCVQNWCVPPPWVSVSAVTGWRVSGGLTRRKRLRSYVLQHKPRNLFVWLSGFMSFIYSALSLSISPERDFCRLRLESIIVSAVMAWSCVQNWCVSAVMSPFCRPAAGHLPPLPSYAFSSICYPCPHYHPSSFILPAIVTSAFFLSPQTIVQSDLPSQQFGQ